MKISGGPHEFEWHSLWVVNDESRQPRVFFGTVPYLIPDDPFVHFQREVEFESKPEKEDVWVGRNGYGERILTYQVPTRDAVGTLGRSELTVTFHQDQGKPNGFTVEGPYWLGDKWLNPGRMIFCLMVAVSFILGLAMLLAYLSI